VQVAERGGGAGRLHGALFDARQASRVQPLPVVVHQEDCSNAEKRGALRLPGEAARRSAANLLTRQKRRRNRFRPRLRKPELIGNVRHLAERRCITPVAKPFCGPLVKKIGLQLVARP
jgi:hypothetical protein